MIWWKAFLLLVLALGGTARAADVLATVTIADGPAVLLRDAGKFGALEGVRLEAADILETGAQARLLRLEFADGAIVDLGPATRVLLAPKLGGTAARKNLRLYLLQGWLKLTAPATVPAGGARLLMTPTLEVAEAGARQAVLAALPDSSMVFSEGGSLTLQDRRTTPPASTALKAGQFAGRSGSEKMTVSPRPTGAFLQNVPRTFLDTLPSRAAHFSSREVAPKAAGDLAYADAAAWLAAEPLLRGYFVTQWRALARKAEFRAGLTDNLRAHPEWDRVLFPEKYLPKPAAPTPARP